MSRVFVIFPQSMRGTEIDLGFAVTCCVSVDKKYDYISFVPYNDTTFVARTIWSDFVRQSVLPALHELNIDTAGVVFAHEMK